VKKVGWGVIGAGGIADRRTLPGLMLAANARLVAVMEVDAANAERLRGKHGASRAYSDAASLVAYPEVDSVYIASPVSCHKEQALVAIAAGKHVLVEKPVALTVVDGVEVMRAARAKGVLAASGFVMRFHGYHRRMRDLVAEGRIGQVVSARAQLTCWYPEIPGAWRQKQSESGGGAIMDLAVHCVDLLHFVLGSPIDRVAALSGTRTFAYEVEDSGTMLLRTQSGAFCTVESYFNIPDSAARCRFEVYGTGGSMLAEGTIGQVEGGRLDVVVADGSLAYDPGQARVEVRPIEVELAAGNLYAKEIEAFGEAVLGHASLEAGLEEAIAVQRVIEAAYESSRSGRFVAVGPGAEGWIE
jgi:predicted dehydrogenase